MQTVRMRPQVDIRIYPIVLIMKSWLLEDEVASVFTMKLSLQMQNILCRLIVVACTLFFAGCQNVPLHPQLGSQNYSQKIPLTVGILIPQSFRNYGYTEWDSGQPFYFEIGQASSTLLAQAFGGLFENTVLLNSRDQPSSSSKALAGTIEPVIEQFQEYRPTDMRYIYQARITFGFILYSSTGERLGSWTVSGYASHVPEHVLFFTQARGVVTDLAMQDAVSNLIAGFQKVPEVRNWLDVSGVRANTKY